MMALTLGQHCVWSPVNGCCCTTIASCPWTAPPPSLDWVRFIRLDPNWKGRLRKTSKLALSYHRARAEHAVWQRHFDARLAAAGATIPDKAKPQVPAEKWQCDSCHKIFASTRALAMHATREHGYKKKVRTILHGGKHVPRLWPRLPHQKTAFSALRKAAKML